MAANDDFKQYPRGNIAMDNGDLIDVTDVKITFKRANKIKHTLRKEAAGKVKGPLEARCRSTRSCRRTVRSATTSRCSSRARSKSSAQDARRDHHRCRDGR
jgi:hypothetical protein